MENNSDDYLFPLELVTTAMRKFTINWQTHVQHDHSRGHFSAEIEDSVLTILEKRGIELFFLFSDEFASKGVTQETFSEVCEHLKSDFTCGSFDAKEFLWYCIILAVYAVMANSRGLIDAPYISILMIFEGVMYFRNKGEFTEDTWQDLEQASIDIAKES